MPLMTSAWRQHAVILAAVLVCVALGASFLAVHTTQYAVPFDFTPAPVSSSALNKLFTESDAKRVVEIARSKQLPLPKLEFDTPR